MSGQRIYCIWLWLMLAAATVSAQTSRASSAASYLERGNSWMAKGEFERAIAVDSRSALAYYNRAIAREHKGDLAGAVSDYDRAIDLNPRCADAYLNRGIIRYRQGARAEGISD